MSRLRVIVLGYMVRGPLGGLAWHHLQYVLALARLGHDVYFVEDSGDYPACYHPPMNKTGTDPGYGIAFAAEAFARIGLGDRWAYFDAHRQRWLGPRSDDVLSLCAGAELVLNLSGVNPLRPWVRGIPVRVLVDTDPVFTQIRHLTNPEAMEEARRHTAFFSFAENMRRSASIPDDGLAWQPTRQPVVLEEWPVTPGAADGKFTTVMQWDSYKPREYEGHQYGMKSTSFVPYLDLPARTGPVYRLAIGICEPDARPLRERGWEVIDPLGPSRDPWTYQRFIQQSRAEFSVAKHGYVVSRSGWFSERSAAYLASGRPVLVQDTGFSDWLPTGEGVLPFESIDEAAAGVEEIERRYVVHCRAAREIAEAYFDARRVLPQLLERALGTGHTRRPDEAEASP